MDPSKPTPAARPSLADRARTQVHTCRFASLSTLSHAVPGFPFASLTAYADDASGTPLLLLSRLAQHTVNLSHDPRASLLITGSGSEDHALSGQRTTIVGEIAPLESVSDDLRARYLAAHPEAQRWIDFGDFAIHRMQITRIYHVAGFGSMGWVEAEDYANAEVDPLGEAASGILEHMNEDHADALVLYAQVFAQFAASEAQMTEIDSRGFALVAHGAEGSRSLRIEFDERVTTPEETRKALVAMVRTARERISATDASA